MYNKICEDVGLHDNEEKEKEKEKEKELEIINEFIAMVKNTDLFTVFIEGSDDVIFYEPLESICDDAPKTIDIRPVGGRNIVLGVFQGLKDTPFINKVVFIVDKDTWIHVGKPHEFEHARLICTSGYSIENDIYMDFDFCNFMISLKVYNDFLEKLEEYISWYAIAIKRVIDDTVLKGDTLNIHPIDFFKNNKKDSLIVLRENESVDIDLLNDIKENFKLKLRGKNLMNLALYVVNSKPNSSRYTTKSIAQISVHNGRKDNLNIIFDAAKSFAMNGF